MIQQTLSLIAGNLNNYLKLSLNLAEDVVILSGILNADGTPAANTANKMILSLAHVAPDQTVRNNSTIGFSTQAVHVPALHLKLQLLCAANFADYNEGLKLLSLTMKFFQSTPVITEANTPGANTNPIKIQPANLFGRRDTAIVVGAWCQVFTIGGV